MNNINLRIKAIYGNVFFCLFLFNINAQNDFIKNYSKAKLLVSINYDSALYYNQFAIMDALDKNNLFNEQLAYTQKGNILFYINKFDSSIHYYLKSSFINKKLANTHYLVRNYVDVAFVYSTINKDFTKLSISWLNKAKNLIKDANDSTKSYYYNTAGVVNLRLNNIDSALNNFRQVYKINKLEQKGSRYALINNIGLCYQKKKKIDSSEYYFNQCIDSCMNNGELRLGAIAKINLANNEFLKSNYHLSIGLAKEAIPILIEKKAIPKLIEGYELLVKNYKQLSIADSVNKYLFKFYNTKDSIFNESIKQQLTSLEKTLELENKNLEIEKKTGEIEASKKQTKLYQLVTLLAIISFLIFTYLITVIIKRNTLLKRQKSIIQENLQIKDNLLGEIHHRVKNNLQLVSSLLELQLVNIKDEHTLKTMNDSKSRINSMIVLHEKLYQSQEITYINTTEYITNLISNIELAYSTGKNIKFVFDSSNLKLGLDTAVPLGLILNEVITNCYKYAFDNIIEPKIIISVIIQNGLLFVSIQDNGIGIVDLNAIKNKSFGYKLIYSLCRQLDAKIKVSNKSGTLVELEIRDYKLYE